MEIEINEDRKHVLVWLRSNEDKALTQPIIDKYRGTVYLVVLFRSGKKDLHDDMLSLLLHNRNKCARSTEPTMTKPAVQ